MMSKLILTAAASAGLTLALAALSAAPAAAQRAQPGQIIVYGTDPCPRSTDDDVVVCYRRPESERFRIPDALRQTGTRQERQSWSKQAENLSTVGSTGLNRCSPVGPMGVAGCAQQEINDAFRALREENAAAAPPPQ
jgi:hypothetical protein